MSEESEAIEAAIIKAVYQGAYSHAENVLIRLRQLGEKHDHIASLEILQLELQHPEIPMEGMT